jgi:Na+/melibiose symporter-like transporter
MHLTMKDKIGYGLGDTACGFVWQATMFLLIWAASTSLAR